MYTLFNNETGAELGTISDAQLEFLRAQLEEESSEDTDYYIMAATIDMMEARGGDPALLALLRTAIGAADSVEIRWG